MTEPQASSQANSLNQSIFSGEGFACSLGLVLALACGLYALFIAGPTTRAMAQQDLQRTIAEENRGFCEKFGMRAGTSEFAACGEALSVVRQKQTERQKAADAGVL